MKVYFRTDASANIGTGHLMRCLALAQACAEQDLECVFLVREPTRWTFCRARHDWQFSIATIPDTVALQQESEFIQAHFTPESNDFLVLDSYDFDSDYLHHVASLNSAHCAV